MGWCDAEHGVGEREWDVVECGEIGSKSGDFASGGKNAFWKYNNYGE